MVSTVLALILAAASAQATDQTRATREAFTRCLQTFVNRSAEAGKTLEAFRAEYPQQCTAQEAAFREAIVRRETALRATRANADEAAQMEAEDFRVSFSERFEMSLPEQPQQAQAQAQPPAQGQPQPQPASQPQ